MKYFLVGIKGVGMSALANLLKLDGHIVEGADVSSDFYTRDNLRNIEVNTFENFKIKKDYFYIIGNAYTNHQITLLIKESNLKYELYPIFISKYFNEYKMIGISGSHGKTMSCSFLKDIVGDLNYLIGDGSFNKGKSEYFLIEACEYKDTFLNYNPFIGLVLNVDYDHPDYFKSFNDYYLSFIKFINKCKICVINGDNVSYRNNHIITYGMKPENDIVFSYNNGEICIGNFSINLGFKGINYAYNFVGIYVILKLLGIKDSEIVKGVKKYKFPVRRNERLWVDNCLVVSDYAHHPNEIKNIYEILKEEYENANIVCIFEPHTISRLVEFKEEYKEILDMFDKCFLYDVFVSVREKNDVKLINEIYDYLGYENYSMERINQYVDKHNILCFLGAGKIYEEINGLKKIYN